MKHKQPVTSNPASHAAGARHPKKRKKEKEKGVKSSHDTCLTKQLIDPHKCSLKFSMLSLVVSC